MIAQGGVLIVLHIFGGDAVARCVAITYVGMVFLCPKPQVLCRKGLVNLCRTMRATPWDEVDTVPDFSLKG